MNEQELARWRIIEEVLNKKLTQREGAISLNISERHLRNLITAYKKKGKQGIVSKHRSKVSNNKYDEQFKNKIFQILAERYSGYGPTLSAEKLHENHSIYVSRETVRGWMIEKGMWHAKHSKKKIHQRRERRACFGELIQGDGSHHIWLEISGIECCLLVFVDDATSKITAMHLSEEETLEAYFTTLKQHIRRYGCFKSLYLDRSAVAKPRVGSKATQFEKALKRLGIELITAYSAQAKGKVERTNRTLQDRFVKYLKENEIATIEEANQVMDDFMLIYNEKFSVVPRSMVNLHKPLKTDFNIDLELCRSETRKLTKDLCFSCDNIVYKVKSQLFLYGGREVDIFFLENGEIKVKFNKKWVEVEIDDNSRKSVKEKNIRKSNEKWLQDDYRAKKLTGWQINEQHKKKLLINNRKQEIKKIGRLDEITKPSIGINCISRFKLNAAQVEVYNWLKSQNINTDDETLCYWTKTYTEKRLKEVVIYAKTRSKREEIRNLGGWIHKFLKTNQTVIDENWKINHEFLIKFVAAKKWHELKIYEKYIKNPITGDDLSLTINEDEFKRSLEALYEKSQLYK